MSGLLAIAISLLLQIATWAREPDSFRGLRFGIPFEEAIKRGNLHSCFPMSTVAPGGTVLGSMVCSGADIDLGSAKASTAYVDHKKRLVEVQITCKSESFNALKTILIERYGPPTESSGEQLQNRMGVTFQDEHLIWSGKAVSIHLWKYAFGELLKSNAEIRLNSYAEEEAAFTEAKRKKSVGAL